jgi:hypothetical protein
VTALIFKEGKKGEWDRPRERTVLPPICLADSVPVCSSVH